MQGQVAIITGSTSGIGLGIAQKSASEGVNIVLNGLGDNAEIKKLYEQFAEKYRTRCHYNNANLIFPEQIENLIKETHKEFGRIDILVNNAGMQHVAPIEEFPNEKWENIIKLNLTASFYTIKNVIPTMKSQKYGRIINIASAHGIIASPYKSAYVASKHGILGLTKSVALEVARNGITVNAICPGYVKTPLVINQIADTARARNITSEEVTANVILGMQATKRFVDIEEVAELVLYLCRPTTASVTGTSLSIDGGWTAQ